MPTPTLYLNTSAVKWTPSGGTQVSLNRISQAGLTFNADVINNRADLDIYDSSAHIVGWKPTVTFAGLNVGFYLTMVTGIGSITWTMGNADDPGGTGSFIWVLNPAMFTPGDYSGPHAQYATGNLTMAGLAADGQTNPLAFTISSSGMFMMMRSTAPTAKGSSPLASIGPRFLPPIATGPAPEGRPVDAVLLPVGTFGTGSNPFRAAARIQVEGARTLGVEPDTVAVRAQGLNRIVTPTSQLCLRHPSDSDWHGQHRLDWHRRDDGALLGYLTDEALEYDEDKAGREAA